MAQLLLRDVEPDVLQKLEDRARRGGRSLDDELRLILQAAAGDLPDAALEQVGRVRALFSGRDLGDSVPLLREDRQR